MDTIIDTKPAILGLDSCQRSSHLLQITFHTLSSPHHQIHLHRLQTWSSPGKLLWYPLTYSWTLQSSPVSLASCQRLPHTPFYIIARALQGTKGGKKHSIYLPTWARSPQAPPHLGIGIFLASEVLFRTTEVLGRIGGERLLMSTLK